MEEDPTCLRATVLIHNNYWACVLEPRSRNYWARSLGGKDPLEKEMAPHSSVLAWENPMDRGAWWATVHGVTKSWTGLSEWTRKKNTSCQKIPSLFFLSHFWFFLALWPLQGSFCHILDNFLEKAMAPHSSTLAWKIPWTEEPGGLQSMGSRRVGNDWVTSLSLFTFMHWRRKMAAHSSILAWRIPGTGEPGGLPSVGSHRVGHDWRDSAAAATTCWLSRACWERPRLALCYPRLLQVSYEKAGPQVAGFLTVSHM